MNEMKLKGVFIYLDSFSHINERIGKALSQYFKNMDSIDAHEFVKKNRRRTIYTLFNLVYYFGFKSIVNFNSYKQFIIKAPFFFRRISKITLDHLLKKKYDFTFQTQSLYDFSLPAVPHFVYTDHTHLAGLYWPDFKTKDQNPKRCIQLEEKLYKKSSCIFVMSTHVQKSLVEHYGINVDKIEVVGAGINTDNYRMEPRSYDSYSTKNILFVGVEWERKGGVQLFEAFKLVLKKIPDATLTIVGCVPYIQHPNVNVVGKIPIEKVSDYYNQASVFCMPTRLEPFGIVFLEAMYHQLPIVASNIGAANDFIEDNKNGYLLPPDDTVGISNQLIYLLSNPNICQIMGKGNQLIVAEGYTWECVAKKMEARILKELSTVVKN